MMNYLFPKERLFPELQAVSDAAGSASKSRHYYSAAQKEICDCTIKLVKSEAPRFEQVMNFALDRLQSISGYEQQLADAEYRLRDDLNDIIERYIIVHELEKQQEASIKAVETAKAEIINAEKTYQLEMNNQISLKKKQAEDALKLAKEKKRAAVINAKNLTTKLVESKKKFTRFKYNRIKHAWTSYAEAIIRIAGCEGVKYQEFTTSLVDVRNRIDELSEHEIGISKPKDESNHSSQISPRQNNLTIADMPNPFDSLT